MGAAGRREFDAQVRERGRHVPLERVRQRPCGTEADREDHRRDERGDSCPHPPMTTSDHRKGDLAPAALGQLVAVDRRGGEGHAHDARVHPGGQVGARFRHVEGIVLSEHAQHVDRRRAHSVTSGSSGN